jgi:hypothetical protein
MEAHVAKAASSVLWPHAVPYKMGRNDHCDFAMCEPMPLAEVGEAADVVAWVEVKCRRMTMSQHGDVMLSVPKYEALATRWHATGLDVVLVAALLDGLWVHRVGWNLDSPPRVRYGGRTRHQRDAADMEPVFHIPRHMWERIGDTPSTVLEWLSTSTAASEGRSSRRRRSTVQS